MIYSNQKAVLLIAEGQAIEDGLKRYVLKKDVKIDSIESKTFYRIVLAGDTDIHIKDGWEHMGRKIVSESTPDTYQKSNIPDNEFSVIPKRNVNIVKITSAINPCRMDIKKDANITPEDHVMASFFYVKITCNDISQKNIIEGMLVDTDIFYEIENDNIDVKFRCFGEAKEFITEVEMMLDIPGPNYSQHMVETEHRNWHIVI